MQNNISLASKIQNPYIELTYTLQPLQTETIFYAHNYFRVLSYSGDADSMKVRFGSAGSETNFTGAGIGFDMEEAVDRAAIRNASAVTPLTIRIAICFGKITDDRLNVSGTLNTSEISNTNAVSNVAVAVATSATLLLAANGLRKNIVIQNLDSVKDLYIGGAGVTVANGIRIPPAGIYSNNYDGAAYYGINSGTGTIDTRVMSN